MAKKNEKEVKGYFTKQEHQELKAYLGVLQGLVREVSIPNAMSKVIRAAISEEHGAELFKQNEEMWRYVQAGLAPSWGDVAPERRIESNLIGLIRKTKEYLHFLYVKYPEPPDSIAKYLLG